jgi:aspartate ammonia-lyase
MKTLKLLSGLFVFTFIVSGLFAQEKYRTETDLLGDIKVPADAYYGVQTARALENFQISGQYNKDYPDFIKAWGMVKLAAAEANTEVGKMPEDILKPIKEACQEIIDGNYLDQFVVDLYQGGAGTSTNMNANEVIANIALEKAGYKKGDYDKIASTNQVNMSQSTNDTYPTALKLGMLLHNDMLDTEVEELA